MGKIKRWNHICREPLVDSYLAKINSTITSCNLVSYGKNSQSHNFWKHNGSICQPKQQQLFWTRLSISFAWISWNPTVQNLRSSKRGPFFFNPPAIFFNPPCFFQPSSHIFSNPPPRHFSNPPPSNFFQPSYPFSNPPDTTTATPNTTAATAAAAGATATCTSNYHYYYYYYYYY